MILTVVLVQPRKSLVLILVKQRQSFAWVCITIIIIVNLFVNRKIKIKKLKKLKADDKNVKFPTQLC